MILAFTSAQVRAAEEPLLAAETSFAGSLMERAAFALAGHCARSLLERRGKVAGGVVVALVGAGNNGGDALHALAYLARRGVRTTAFLVADRAHAGGLAALRRAGGHVEEAVTGQLAARVWAADVVLDALTGIGSAGALRGPAAELVGELVRTDPRPTGHRPPGAGAARGDEPLAPGGTPGAEQDAGPGPLVVAVDVPSGIGVDDGTLPGPVLRAESTVTFGAPKPGLLLPPAAHIAGDLKAVDLGLDLPVTAPALRRLEGADLAAHWPVPGAGDHKYSRGVLGVVAGSGTYPGAAVLTVEGAARAGAGMVRYLGPPEAAAAVLAARPETVTEAGRVQAWTIGPGTSADDDARLSEALRLALEHGEPVVADAGAIAVVGEHPDPLPPHVVLTPHAGEAAALARARGEVVERVDVVAEPLRWARRLHELTGATVLLKGAVTVVVGPGGALAQAGAPPWLATAGAGDVLAGVLGALLAGHAEAVSGDPDLPARLAATATAVCGRAAELANPGGPVTAKDVADAVPRVVATLLRRNA